MKTYRPCVGIALLNIKQELFIGKRIYLDQSNNDILLKPWQMPQGGIDNNEYALTAAIRELFEETGITKISYLYKITDLQYYDFPPELKLQKRMQFYLGQAQQWFFFHYYGNNDEIEENFSKVDEKEFDAWRWANKDLVPSCVVNFKTILYNRVLSVISLL